MEDWVWIIFVVISFGVWLVVTVFKKAEEERQRNLQKQQPRPGGGRRPTTDLDRFLEEARRRRGDTGAALPLDRPRDMPWAKPVQSQPPAAAPPRRPVATPPQVQRPARPPAFQPSVRRSASEQRPRTPMIAAPPPKPALAPVVLEIVEEELVTAPIAAQPTSAQVPLTQVAGVLGARETRTISPFLKQLQGMVGRPQSTATAFVLVEIFGPPVSRKWMG